MENNIVETNRSKRRHLQKQLLQIQRHYVVLEPFRKYITLKYPVSSANENETVITSSEQEVASSPITVSPESRMTPHFNIAKRKYYELSRVSIQK